MVKSNVHLNGYIDVPDEMLEAVKAALPEHISLTHAEDGCLKFNVTPCEKVPGRFLVAETFVNQSAFDAHQKRTRASDWAAVTKDVHRSYEITIEE